MSSVAKTILLIIIIALVAVAAWWFLFRVPVGEPGEVAQNRDEQLHWVQGEVIEVNPAQIVFAQEKFAVTFEARIPVEENGEIVAVKRETRIATIEEGTPVYSVPVDRSDENPSMLIAREEIQLGQTVSFGSSKDITNYQTFTAEVVYVYETAE